MSSLIGNVWWVTQVERPPSRRAVIGDVRWERPKLMIADPDSIFNDDHLHH